MCFVVQRVVPRISSRFATQRPNCGRTVPKLDLLTLLVSFRATSRFPILLESLKTGRKRSSYWRPRRFLGRRGRAFKSPRPDQTSWILIRGTKLQNYDRTFRVAASAPITAPRGQRHDEKEGAELHVEGVERLRRVDRQRADCDRDPSRGRRARRSTRPTRRTSAAERRGIVTAGIGRRRHRAGGAQRSIGAASPATLLRYAPP
jgi:hypothetical protein